MKTYYIEFTGRLSGALGDIYHITEIMKTDSYEDMINQLYKKYECVKLTYWNPINMNSHIIVDNGNTFDGNRIQFMDCFFSNADNKKIIKWGKRNNHKIEIDGVIYNENK